jgi:hypothetical protein
MRVRPRDASLFPPSALLEQTTNWHKSRIAVSRIQARRSCDSHVPLSGGPTPHCPFNAFSNSRLIASDRDGFGSGWRSIQASSLAFSSAGMRTPVCGVIPVRGRPGGLFCFSAIDLTPVFGQQKPCRLQGSPEFGFDTRKRPTGRRPMVAVQHRLSRPTRLAVGCSRKRRHGTEFRDASDGFVRRRAARPAGRPCAALRRRSPLLRNASLRLGASG